MTARIDAAKVKQLCSELEGARASLRTAEALLSALELAEHTSVVITITVRNDEFRGAESQQFAVPLTDLLRFEKKPRAVAKNVQMLAATRRHAQERVIGWKSHIEGLEFQIRRITR